MLARIGLTILALVLTLYIASTMIELMFGRPRPGFVPVAQLILVAPILFWLWRDKIHPAD